MLIKLFISVTTIFLLLTSSSKYHFPVLTQYVFSALKMRNLSADTLLRPDSAAGWQGGMGGMRGKNRWTW